MVFTVKNDVEQRYIYVAIMKIQFRLIRDGGSGTVQ